MTSRPTIDPNPCLRYRWPELPACPGVYSGSHLCPRPGGHRGACRCACCDRAGCGKDIADRGDPVPE